MYNKADKKQVAQDEESNYNFKLKCMVAAGSALIALSIFNIALLALTAKATTASMAVGASALAASPIIPLIGMVTLIIASLCVLPLLFSGSSTVYVDNHRPITHCHNQNPYPHYNRSTTTHHHPGNNVRDTTTHHHPGNNVRDTTTHQHPGNNGRGTTTHQHPGNNGRSTTTHQHPGNNGWGIFSVAPNQPVQAQNNGLGCGNQFRR